MTTAGAVGLAGNAAVDALDAAGPQAGRTVLISGPERGVNRYGFYATDQIRMAVTRADIAAFTRR